MYPYPKDVLNALENNFSQHPYESYKPICIAGVLLNWLGQGHNGSSCILINRHLSSILRK